MYTLGCRMWAYQCDILLRIVFSLVCLVLVGADKSYDKNKKIALLSNRSVFNLLCDLPKWLIQMKILLYFQDFARTQHLFPPLVFQLFLPIFPPWPAGRCLTSLFLRIYSQDACSLRLRKKKFPHLSFSLCIFLFFSPPPPSASINRMWSIWNWSRWC